MLRALFVIFTLSQTAICIEHDLKGFDDSILFGINWPGAQENAEQLITGDTQDTNTPGVSNYFTNFGPPTINGVRWSYKAI